MIDSMVKNGSVNYFDNDPTGTPLAIHLSGSQADFYVLDGNGTPVALIDGTGTQTDPVGVVQAKLDDLYITKKGCTHRLGVTGRGTISPTTPRLASPTRSSLLSPLWTQR